MKNYSDSGNMLLCQYFSIPNINLSGNGVCSQHEIELVVNLPV